MSEKVVNVVCIGSCCEGHISLKRLCREGLFNRFVGCGNFSSARHLAQLRFSEVSSCNFSRFLVKPFPVENL